MRIKSKARNLSILIVAFLTLLSALLFVGNVANARFNEIITSLIESNNMHSPAKGIERVRSLLGESELTVKAYTLTKDEEFMTRFYEQIYETIDQLEAFDTDSTFYPEEINVALDTLNKLSMRRINLFETIIETGDEFRVERAMNKVSSVVSDLNQDLKTDASELPEEEKKRGLFKRDKGIDKKQIADQVNEKNEAVISEFKAGLQQLSAQEKSREANLRNVILLLSTDGENLNRKIDSISALINDIEGKNQEAEAKRIANIAASSSTAVRYGVIISVILVLVFTTLIFIQIRNSYKFARATKRASQEAVNLADAKERFVANVSHELRTPLNSIIGFSDLIEETKNPIQINEYQGMIKASAQHLGALVNDLLDWSKIDAGKFELEVVPFSPQELLNEVRNITFYGKNSKNVSFTIKSEITSSFLNGDPTRLKQMLINILGNAFKFTDQGSIVLEVKEWTKSQSYSTLQFTIKDTGIGIPKDKLKNVFGDFEQVDSSTSRKFGGSGLGLAITKRLVDLHGGKISVSSEVGKGTTFNILLDYEKTAMPSKSNKGSETIDLSQLSILVVDDSELNRNLLSTILNKMGCKVESAASAEKALKLLSENRYHFGLFDIKMPEIDGFELAEKAQQIVDYPIKLIALTAAPTEDIIAKGLAAGYEAVLGKPINKDQLFAMLLGEEVYEAKDEPETANRKAIDIKLINQIFENDNDFRDEMLHAFVTTIERELPLFAKAVEDQDHSIIDDLTHKLMPSCRQIGAKNLMQKLELLKHDAQSQVNANITSEHLYQFEREFEKVKKSIIGLINS